MQKTLVHIAFASAALLAASAAAQDIQQDRPVQQQDEQPQQVQPRPEQQQQAQRQQPQQQQAQRQQAQRQQPQQQQAQRQQPQQQQAELQQPQRQQPQQQPQAQQQPQRQQSQQPPQQQAQQGGSIEPFQGDVEELTEENDDFRRVLHTGSQMQLVVMSIEPGDEIGLEAHPVEQCLYIVDGMAQAVVNERTVNLTSGGMACVPSGAQHNVINTGNESLKLFTVYSPPEHAAGTVHATRADAERAEQERPA